MTPPSTHRRTLLNRLFLSPEERRLRAGWRLALQFFWMAALLGVFGLPIGLMTRLQTGSAPQVTLFVSAIVAFLAITGTSAKSHSTSNHQRKNS